MTCFREIEQVWLTTGVDRIGWGILNLFAAAPRTWQASTMKVDWSKAPKRARWWAVDEDGKAHWFCAPNVAAFTKFWFSEPKPAPTFGFTGDWRKSLVERPIAS